MRKHLTLFAILLLAASCVNEELPNDDSPADSSRVVFKATAAIQNESDALAIKWEATKDKIGLFLSSGGEDLCINGYFYAFSSTQESSFIDYSDNLSLEHVEGKQVDLMAYYPYRSSAKDAKCLPCSLDDRQKVVLDQMPDLKKNNVFYTCQKDVVYGKDEHMMCLMSAYSLVKVNMSFNRPVVCSSMLVKAGHADPLAFASGSLDMNTGSITAAEGASSQIELFSESEMSFQPGEARDVYFLVAPGHAGGKFLLSFEHNGTDVEMEITLPQEGLEAGKVYSCSCDFDFSDIAFENLSANGTANTYIVSKSGAKYGFDPHFKGNGIERSFSWTFNGEPCQTNISDVQINPADIKLLWYNNPDNTQDCPIVPESVIYDTYSGKVFFDTPAEFVEGNAVLAAFNESGEIIWSWNIWAVKNYNPDVAARSVGRFTVMDRNLGSFAGSEAATMSAEDAAAAIGNYYQWGRKDPLPAAESFSPSGWGLKTYTPIAGYQKAGGVIFTDNRTDNVYCIGKEIGSSFTLEQAVNASVAHPHKAMANGTSDNQSPYNWLLPSYSSSEMMQTTADRVLWRTMWGSVDGYNNVKTIYDPCPPGWKVPTGDMYVYALGGAVSSANGLGYYSEKFDLFFPCAGQRQAGFGGSNLSGVGTAVFYSNASVTDPYIPFMAGMASYNSYGGAGYQLRCVKEEQPSEARPIGYQDGPVAVLMGDSITETWPTRGRKDFFTENDYVGVGISGQTTRDMLNRFYNDVLSRNPQVIVVTGGSNDLAYNDGVNPCREDIKNNVMIMIEMAKAWGAEVIVGSSFPSRHYWWNYDGTTPKSFWPYSPEETAQRAVDLGAELKAYADANGYAYADYFTVLKNDENNLADEFCWSFGTSWAYAADGLDRVHPNAAGFLEMEKVLKPLVQSVLNDPNQVTPGGSSSDDFGKIEW